MGTITANFSYWEFEQSEKADKKGICNVIRTFEVRDAVKELTEMILQPLRDAWGGPITISSGWRCEELNKEVGGSATSAHKTGYAADIVPNKGDLESFFQFVKKWLTENKVKFDQCAIEGDKYGAVWVHIGLYGPNRRQLGGFYRWAKK
ncbi:MAG: D-Ala-D-Ala carboxypeptidase family metallohydrolase [Candidatus Cryptobacteroides sp.]